MFIGQNIANSMARQASNPSDYQLQQYVDQVMRRYDTNFNGTLEANEIASFFNELFVQCGIPKRINTLEASNFMRKVDTNFDGKANKFELFRAFKSMMVNQGGFTNTNAYASEWDPNFSGYARVAPTYNAYSSYGGGYNNYGARGLTTQFLYSPQTYW